MPKEYFSVDRTSSLRAIPARGKIHVIGVSGVAMAQLAVALSKRGYQLSGSDKDFYEPMGSFLRQHPVTLTQGYAAQNVPSDVDLVIIGNAVSYGHPEVAEVERRGLPYTLFPKALFELAIEGKHSIVVTGTHGKTTTTALGAFTLSELGAAPSFFIGGAVPGFETSLIEGAGRYSIVEGDEYDSSFFAKVPKFSFYRPQTLIVTSIEYDHADIYPSIEAINSQFEGLVSSMPEGGHVIVCVDSENVRNQLARWNQSRRLRISTYGVSGAAEYRVSVRPAAAGSEVTLSAGGRSYATFSVAIPGEHNALNATAVYLALTTCGFDASSVGSTFGNFRGVRRRQEVRFDAADTTVIDDFAHHPTAVRETLRALRTRYPDRKLVAIFEPRSNTSRRKVFQDEYVAAFSEADQVVLCDVTARSIDPLDQLIDVRTLGERIHRSGIPTVVLPDAEAILAYLQESSQPGWVMVVMSNGGFGGLVQRLVDQLNRR